MTTPAVPKCNRCRRHLKAVSSIIRGVGPVCARRILSHLAAGLRGKERTKFLTAVFASEVNEGILNSYDGVVAALQADGCQLDIDHRGPLSEKLLKSRIELVEYVLVIYADVCNCLSQATTVAEAVKQFFIILGLGDDEANKAYKRLIKIAKKVGTF